MSSVTFARSLFRDLENINELTKKSCDTGQRPQNTEIAKLGETIKRVKQTCNDWDLFASLQESSDSNMSKIKDELNVFLQASVQAVKAPSSDMWVNVSDKFKILCNSIGKTIGQGAIKEIEGLEKYILPFEQQNVKYDPTKDIKELKDLAMKALIDLKELSRIVLEAIRSRESTASHFAQAARSSAQTLQRLAIFATEVSKLFEKINK